MAETEPKTTAPIKIILAVTFVDLVSFGLIIPLLPAYAERMGAKGLTLGLLVGSYSLVQLVFNPLLGRWSDHVGRRRVLMISIAGSIFSHLLLGFADMSASLVLLFIARILDGITGANIATAQAYIADVTTPENRARGMGLFGAAFGLGFVLGPGIGAGLCELGLFFGSGEYATSWAAFGAAVISTVAFLLVWRKLPESRPAPSEAVKSRRTFQWTDLSRTFRDARLVSLFALMFSALFAFVLLEVSFAYLCIKNLSADMRHVALVFAYIGVLIVIVQGGLVGRLSRRFGEARLISIGPFITALGFFIIALVPGFASIGAAWVVLLLACIPIAGGNGITSPNVTSLISRQAEEHRQGATLGLAQGFGSLARAIAPPIGGLLFDLNPSWPYIAGGVIFCAVGVFALTIRGYFPHKRSVENETAACAAP
jgi:MFS family permease